MIKRSPFPGMDPYLERRWGDVHLRLCATISAVLQSRLPDGLQAIGQEEVRLQELDDDGNLRMARFYPDAAVIEMSGVYDRPAAQPGAVTTVTPIKIRRMSAPPVNRWIEIIDTTDHSRVVTAIEVLSPGNKAAGTLNRDYVQKVDEYIKGGVNVVEIDLLRSTRDRLIIPTGDLPREKQADYYSVINRSSDPDNWDLYPMQLRQPLPAIPIPLRETDAEIPLELQPVIDQVYIDGGHYRTNYTAELPRPFNPADAAWAVELIKESGR